MNGVSNMLLLAGGILMAIVFGANSFDPKALNIMRLQNNCGILVIKCLCINYSNLSWFHRSKINQVFAGPSWRYVSNFWWLWIYRLLVFLAGYLTQGIKYITRNLPQAVEGLKPTLIYPLLSVTITDY